MSAPMQREVAAGTGSSETSVEGISHVSTRHSSGAVQLARGPACTYARNQPQKRWQLVDGAKRAAEKVVTA
jgi:hypothetical protein